MDKIEKGRALTEEETKEILQYTPNNIDESTFLKYFATTVKKPKKFRPYDTMIIPKNCVFNDKPIESTVGRYLFNLFMLEYDLIKLIGYQNYEMAGGISKMTSQVDRLLLENKITGERYVEFLNKQDFLYALSKFLAPSLTLNILKPTPKASALKNELLKKHEKEIKENNYLVMGDIEKKVLAQAKEEIKDIPDFDIYASGAGGGMGKAFNNAFKNMTYFRGTIRNLADENSYYISTHSLLEGIPPEEMDKYADITVQASYGRAVGTRQGGYEYKKIASALQGLVAGEKGSDCGTKLYKELLVDKDISKMILYRYIIEGDKLVLLTPDNINSYIGKKIKLRTPLYCKANHFCNKCMGELYYLMNLQNVGLTASRVGTALLNESLKAFHDLTLKIVNINVFDYIE